MNPGNRYKAVKDFIVPRSASIGGKFQLNKSVEQPKPHRIMDLRCALKNHPKTRGAPGNSNSLIASVLRALGINFKPSEKVPGWNKAVL